MNIHIGNILSILRDCGPQSRADLARRSSLSATTLTHVTARLLKEGLVIESETAASSRLGRPAHALHLARDARKVAGVHIGAGNIQIALTDLCATPRITDRFEFDIVTAEPAGLVDRIADRVQQLAAEIQIDPESLVGVGVGFPGAVDAMRRVALTSINLGFGQEALADRFEKRLKVPAVLTHNVSAMALAESRYGVGRRDAALLFVYLKTGLGAGLVVDGVLFRPGGYGTVELGHIQVERGGRRCACGNSGCLEAYVCEAALIEKTRAADLPTDGPLLAMLERDDEAYEQFIEHLTTGLANAVNLLSPDVVVFGGHIGEASDQTLRRLRDGLNPRIMPHLRGHLRFERTSFGWFAGAIGAAALALDEFFYSGACH